METVEYRPQGVCCKQMYIEFDNEIIKSVEFIGGCHGNLQGIASLVAGMNLNDVIAKLRGIKCGSKNTSCPDQLACCLEEYIKEKQEEKTKV